MRFIFHILLLLLLALNSAPRGIVVAHDYVREEAVAAQSCWNFRAWKEFSQHYCSAAAHPWNCAVTALWPGCLKSPMAFKGIKELLGNLSSHGLHPQIPGTGKAGRGQGETREPLCFSLLSPAQSCSALPITAHLQFHWMELQFLSQHQPLER